MKGNLKASKRDGFNLSEKHFGGNFLFDRDFLDPDSNYLDVLEKLKITHLRFPGGTITEKKFDIHNWSSNTDKDGNEIVPLQEYLQFIRDNNLTTSIVLPTKNLFVGSSNASVNQPRALDFDEIDATLDLVEMILSKNDTRVPSAKISAASATRLAAESSPKIMPWIAPLIPA